MERSTPTMPQDKRNAPVEDEDNAVNRTSSKKLKLTTEALPGSLNTILTTKDRNQARQHVFDSMSAEDLATYKRIYNNAGKSKNASTSYIERTTAQFREFLATRPETLRLHNMFAQLHRATGNQAIPLPRFPELKREDGHSNIERVAPASPNNESPAASTLADEYSLQQDASAVTQPPTPIDIEPIDNDNMPLRQTIKRDHSPHEPAAAENDAKTDFSSEIPPSKLGELVASGFPFVRPMVEVSPLFQDNLVANQSHDPTVEDAKSHENLPGLKKDETENGVVGDMKPATAFSGEVDMTNPQDFKLRRVRNMQDDHPSTKIIRIAVQVESGVVKRITIHLDQSIVEDFTIEDPRIIAHLGLTSNEAAVENFNTIRWQTNFDAAVPSWVLQPDKRIRPDGTLGGKLEIPRHSYLAWLELRRKRFPDSEPYSQEVRSLAKTLGFHNYWDCMRELRDTFRLEQGPHGAWYRDNRSVWLGGDPFGAAPGSSAASSDKNYGWDQLPDAIPSDLDRGHEATWDDMPAHPYTMWLRRHFTESRVQLPTLNECKPIAQELGLEPYVLRTVVMQHWSTENGSVSEDWYKRNKRRILSGQKPTYVDEQEREQMSIWWKLLRNAETASEWRHWD